jgi:hypothetical protein
VWKVSPPFAPNPDGSLPSPDPRVWTEYTYDGSGPSEVSLRYNDISL